MFSVGESEDSKLEENMEEIKHLVEGDGSDKPGGQKKDLEQTFQTPESQREEQREGEEPEAKLQEEIEKFENEVEQEEDPGKLDPAEEFDNSEQRSSMNETKRGVDATENSSQVESEIPEPAETRDLDVPNIEKGPLFINRRKFDSAKRMIYEMRQLSREIETTVESMEQDIKRSRETEQTVQKILNEFEQNRGDVEKIVSPE